ncbi:MAG: PQQ-binding-like beta-propeller repeat protein, partial [Bacteroidota bacterium]|nr:PQQ-binding-like beta-propeller repeat protein [Bacteroidota bacterium]
IITDDSCVISTIEKQYIIGRGGVFKFNPKKYGTESVEWFFPVENNEKGSWEGGIVGSAAINDFYEKSSKLAAFVSVKGNLYLINHEIIDQEITNLGPNEKHRYPSPLLLDKINIGPSISTPLLIRDKLIVAGYQGLKLFKITTNKTLKLLASYKAPFEATPFVYDKKIYVASRDGYLYCFGN